MEPPGLPPELPVTLRYAVCAPLSLDPGRAGDDLTAFVIGQLMEGLVELDEAWGIVRSLASRWTVTSDGRGPHLPPAAGLALERRPSADSARLRVCLEAQPGVGGGIAGGAAALCAARRPGVRRGKRSGGGRRRACSMIGHWKARPDRPAGYFPQVLTHPVTFPLPRWVVEGERQPWTAPGTFVCNGAWLLEAWEPGKHMAFTRTPSRPWASRGNAAVDRGAGRGGTIWLFNRRLRRRSGRHQPAQDAADARGRASSSATAAG